MAARMTGFEVSKVTSRTISPLGAISMISKSEESSVLPPLMGGTGSLVGVVDMVGLRRDEVIDERDFHAAVDARSVLIRSARNK